MKSANFVLAKNGKHLTKEKERKQRWKEYMEELYGSNRPGITHIGVQNSTEISDVTTEEILNATKSLKNNKATGSDEIPIEYLKSVGEDTKAKKYK